MAGLGPLNVWGPAWRDFQGPGKAVPAGWSSELPVSSQGPPQGWAPDQAESAQLIAHAHLLALLQPHAFCIPGSSLRQWIPLLAPRLLH